jgi:hypothetical protein
MIETVIISLTMAFCGKIMTEERAAVLIDNSYLRKEVLDVYKGKQGRFRLDYVKFSNSLCRDIDASLICSTRNWNTSLQFSSSFTSTSFFSNLSLNAESFRNFLLNSLGGR